MISVYKIKPAFQKLLQPILNFLFKIGITANQLTVFSILFSSGLGLMFLQHDKFRILLLLLPLGLLIRMALNALDGMMAKQFNMQTKLGEVLNEIGDVVSDLFIILPFIILPEMDAWIIILFAILTILNEFSGILAKAINGERRYDGPMGKSDRAFIIGLFCIVYFFWDGIESYTNWIFGSASLLVIISTLIRLKKAIQ